MTIKRLLTGIILLPLLILLLIKGSPFLFACLILLLCLLGLGEFYRMALPGLRLEGTLAAIAGTAAVAFFAGGYAIPFLLPITLFFLGFSLIILFRFEDIARAAQQTALILLGFCYVPLLIVHLILLRTLDQGVNWLLLLMLIVMSNDTAAFYVGSALGRRKLYPQVSPNKSVEGAVGGLLGSIAGTLVAKFTFFPALRLSDCLITAIVIGILGQLGDLFESLLKRSFGVKDSGTIFPGHGGVLDRLDSILFAAPALYYYAALFRG